MRWNIIVECVGEDGQQSTITLGALNGSPGVRLPKTSESIFKSVRGIRRSVSERRAYFDRPCGEHRQSIDQLANVQEAPNGMEPSGVRSCRSSGVAEWRGTGWRRPVRGRWSEPELSNCFT
jgi:hypothetical protein